MQNQLKIASPWMQLAWALFFLGACLIFTALLQGGILAVSPLWAHSLNGQKVIQALSSIGVFLLPAYLYAWISFRGHSFSRLGFRPSELPIFYLLAIVLLFCSFPLEGWMGQINSMVRMPQWAVEAQNRANDEIAVFLKTKSFFDILVNLLVMAALPAICEEAYFRGALQRILIQAFRSPWAGILVTAAFFSAFHMQFQGFLPRMFLGALLGAIYWYSGSLWASILAHFFTNGIQVIAVSYQPKFATENPNVPVYAALISLVIVVGLLYQLKKQSKTTYSKVYGEIDPTI